LHCFLHRGDAVAMDAQDVPREEVFQQIDLLHDGRGTVPVCDFRPCATAAVGSKIRAHQVDECASTLPPAALLSRLLGCSEFFRVISDEAFARYDSNKNGRMDFDEAARFVAVFRGGLGMPLPSTPKIQELCRLCAKNQEDALLTADFKRLYKAMARSSLAEWKAQLPYPKVTRDSLLGHWPMLQQQLHSSTRCRVLAFHKENERHGHFSNWFEHEAFQFDVPLWCRLPDMPDSIPVVNSEIAIMLCKAGLFGDRETYTSLRSVRFPKDAKDLGAGVRNFHPELWNAVLPSVAYAVVLQKFAKLPKLKALLLATGDAILAEAAPSDIKWGIGLAVCDGCVHEPSSWRGSNALGWALMEARKTLAL